MIDFVKFELVKANARWLEIDTILEFKTIVSTETGEIGRFKIAYYKGLKFTIIEQTEKYPNSSITVEGSLHKYWNNGEHNFNDFGSNEILEVLQELKEKFNIKPINCILKQLELGVNINPSYETKTILKSCLLHKTTPFKWVYVKDEGEYKQVRHQKYIVKIYNKRKHYQNKHNIESEIMRFEIKYLKMFYWHNLKIYTLKDLIFKFRLENSIYSLIDAWRNVLFYNYIVLDDIYNEHKYSNPNFWGELTYQKLKYHRDKLNEMTDANPPNIKNWIEKLICEKVEFLCTKSDGYTPII